MEKQGKELLQLFLEWIMLNYGSVDEDSESIIFDEEFKDINQVKHVVDEFEEWCLEESFEDTGICPFCKKSVKIDEFHDELSLKEYTISGLCQKCQDEFFD